MEKSGKPTHIHFVGICGVGMGAMAIAFHKAGWKVTGSDKGFYPPISTNLEAAGIPFYAGFHPDKMFAQGSPDLVVVGTSSGSTNPETTATLERNIRVLSDAEVRGEYFAKKCSILTAGTWGKTSSTALLAHILRESGKDPSYLVGGIPVEMDAARLTGSKFSVIEGDEYKSGPTNPKAKFDYIPVTHLLLTGVSWDHADVYPTEDLYFAAFERLIERVPKTGLIVTCVDNAGVRRIIGKTQARVVTYGKRKSADYHYVKIAQSSKGLRFGIKNGNEAYAVESPLLGDFQAENITGSFALAKEIGLPAKEILLAIASFRGIKRRLEKRFENDKVAVIDDIAHSPDKARSTLKTLRAIYPNQEIIAIFEPNTGSRSAETAVKYTDAFSAADTVIIPKLTKLKIDPNAQVAPLSGADLASLIARSHSSAHYIPNDDKLVAKLVSLSLDSARDKNVVIVFLGSHSFRTMIDQVVERLKAV